MRALSLRHYFMKRVRAYRGVDPVKFVSRSLRLKISLGVGLALILLLVPYNWLQYRLQRRVAISDLSQLAASSGALAEHSLEGAMLSNNRPACYASHPSQDRLNGALYVDSSMAGLDQRLECD